MGPEKLDNGVYYIRALLRPRRHGALQARRRHRDVGDRSLAAQAAAAVRGHVVGHAGPAVRGLAARPRQRRRSFQKHWIGQVPMEAELNQRRRGDAGRRLPRPRDDRARRARELVLQRRPPRQPRPLPHRLRRRPGRQGRLRDLLADDLDPGRRRGQLRSPRRRPAAALHRRQRGDDVLRAGHRQHARRAARRDAGDLPVGAERRPDARASRRTSTAAGPAARCSCRRGATTAPRGRSSTSSSACGPTSTTACSQVVPQVPAGQPQRGGLEHPARRAARWASSPRTTARATRRKVDATRTPVRELVIGHTLPRASQARGGRCSTADASSTTTPRATNRGLEVTVATGPGTHTLVVTAG